MKKLLFFLVATSAMFFATQAKASDDPTNEQASKPTATVTVSYVSGAGSITGILNCRNYAASDLYIYVEGTVEYIPFVSTDPNIQHPESFKGVLHLPAGERQARTVIVPNTGPVDKITYTRADILMPTGGEDDTYIYTVRY